MFKSRFSLVALGMFSVAALSACDLEPQEFRFQTNISGIQFEFFDAEEGIHPNQVVLLNPNNPFRNYGVGAETKWDILAEGGNAGAFYAWATLLAQIPTGEHQYYAATKLQDIVETNEVPEEDRPKVRQLAIAGFQSVLDNFPDSVSFDATGTTPFRLATPAFLAILDLGGVPQGDWVLVADPQGNPTAVRGAGVDREIERAMDEEDDG